ncbi:MAG: 3-isopropylmalate dehydrogenase [Patescibacteria group bacterium]|nr:3-isopropylmalate dehydrogenase [Patescibacteria group bacterium]
MKKHIAVLPGDGVGPEIVTQARVILDAVSALFGHSFTYEEGLIGAAAIDETGDPYPQSTHDLCKKSDAILFGAIGDPRFDNDPSAKVRPEQGLLKMRKSLGLYANVRPIHTFASLLDASPLKREIVEGVDFVVVRELTGGIYFGEPRGRSDNRTRAFDTSVYTKEEILRVSRFAFELASKRRKKITVVDKANVLETSRLWRETIQEYAEQWKDIEVEYMFVDNASMQIIRRPSAFDVLLTENMFGDILTDEASVITGSIGMLPSASIGADTAIYEPIHGSYPQAAGKNTANPVGTILSVAMMLEYSFGLHREAAAVYRAVTRAIEDGHGTRDIRRDSPESTTEFGAAIARYIE